MENESIVGNLVSRTLATLIEKQLGMNAVIIQRQQNVDEIGAVTASHLMPQHSDYLNPSIRCQRQITKIDFIIARSKQTNFVNTLICLRTSFEEGSQPFSIYS